MYFNISILDTYKQKSQTEKLDFWDRQIPFCNFEKHDSRQLLNFIKQIISDLQENTYSKCKAIEFSFRLFLADIFKDRNILDILLDSWETTDNIHIEVLRIKRLALLYPYDNDIQSILEELAKDDSLVTTESNYQLGLVNLFNAREKETIEELVDVLKVAYFCFEKASQEENRIDAILFKTITALIIHLFNNNWLEFDRYYEELERLIFIQQVNIWNPDIVTLHLGIYSKLYNAKNVIEKDTEKWLNYKIEFDQLSMEFYNIQNQSIKSELFFSQIESNISNNIVTKVIEPVFKSNFYSVICKIDCLLNDEKIGEKQIEFLKYLKNVIQKKSITEISDFDFFSQSIINTFPHMLEADRKIFYDAFRNSDLQGISYSLDCLAHNNGYEKLIDCIIDSCIKLQGTRHYYNAEENVRNKFISQLLEASGFRNKDQTQWGLSNTGISDGEIDIQIVDKKGVAFSVVEGIILDSLNTSYLNLHLDKIFKYDTTGLEYNFIISYVGVSDFFSFWNKYCEHIKVHKFQYPLQEFYKDNYRENYAEIKTGLSSHLRSGNIVYLYHICLNMPKVVHR